MSQGKSVPRHPGWPLALAERAFSIVPPTERAPVVILIVLVIAVEFSSPEFFSIYNLANLLSSISIIGIMACGMTFVIISGGIDLSIGSVFAVGGAIGACFAGSTSSAFLPNLVVVPAGFAILIGIGAAGLLGLLNGLIITRWSVVPFITTLGMMASARGVAYLYTDGFPLNLNDDTGFRWIGTGMLGAVPVPVVIFGVVAVVAALALRRTRFGRYVYAVGHNEEVARLNGIATDRVKLLCYTITGSLAGLSGIIIAAKVNAGVPTAGLGYELDVITAVVIGGVSLFGGQGTILGTVIGVAILGILSNGLGLLGVPVHYRPIATGVVLILAIIYNFARLDEK